MATLADDGIRIIDADTHFTEPYDMWTSRAPAEFKDRVPHVEEIEGEPTWVVDGTSLGFARGGGVVDKHGERIPFLDSMEKGQDWVHRGAFDPKARLQVMDESGIYAQVLFPSIIGLGGQSVNGKVGDPELRQALHRDLQRRHGRDGGRVRRPLHRHAGPARLGHRRLRQGGRAGRRDRACAVST